MLFFYPTTRFDGRDRVLKGIESVFSKLKILAETNEDLELLEFHDMFKEGYISPHDYYTAKYKYKNLIIETGTLFDSHIGSSCWCNILAPEKELCMTYKGVEITEENPLQEKTKKIMKTWNGFIEKQVSMRLYVE